MRIMNHEITQPQQPGLLVALPCSPASSTPTAEDRELEDMSLLIMPRFFSVSSSPLSPLGAIGLIDRCTMVAEGEAGGVGEDADVRVNGNLSSIQQVNVWAKIQMKKDTY